MSESYERYAESNLPTHYGQGRVLVYRATGNGAAAEHPDEHVALVFGEPKNPALVRVHSECLTGEVFGSLRCDCRAQLELAMEAIASEGSGAIVYLRQEGRGIGLGNKIRAYALQDEGADTVAANESLGFAADARRYRVAAAILDDLGITSVRLMTNNPAKVEGLQSAGVRVVERLDHWTEEGAHNREYLEVKRVRMGHLKRSGRPPSEEQDAS